jgi:hypothetical protein
MDSPRMSMAVMTMADLQKAGEVFFTSGMFPDVKSAAQATIKVMAGAELGIPPIASMRGVNVMMGRVSLSADLIAALVKRGKRYNFAPIVHTANKCEIEWYESGKKVHISSFTIEEAEQAGLFGKPQALWEKYPRDMLYARALTRGAKVVCPQRLAGLDLDEEASIPDEAIEVVSPTTTNGNGHSQLDAVTGEYHEMPATETTAEHDKKLADDAAALFVAAEKVKQPAPATASTTPPYPSGRGNMLNWIEQQRGAHKMTPQALTAILKAAPFFHGSLSGCTDEELVKLADMLTAKWATQPAPEQPVADNATTEVAEDEPKF